MSETILVAGGHVVARDSVVRADVLVRDGVIVEVADAIAAPPGATVIDAADCWVGPGFLDLHTHLREPGREEAETIESGARAAAIGGYSAIVAMPNTEPAIDSVITASYVLERGRRAAVEVAVAGAITVGRAGEHLAPMAEMAELGVRLFTDDGNGVQNPSVMRRAMTYAAPLGVRLAQHCEDEHLAAGGVMHEGELSSKLGLRGRPALSEELMVLRDLELVRLTGAALHFLHLSTARSLALVTAARSEGLPVSCEVAPHHLEFDESACEGYDPTFKVHPPLRSRRDVDALRAAVIRGDVDAVATDHAPHAPQYKDLPFDEAPPGMLGLEHAASVVVELLGPERPTQFFDVLSRRPAAIAQLRANDVRVQHSAHGGEMRAGEDANVVIFDPAKRYVVDRTALQSRSLNTPYQGRAMIGATRALVVRGRVVVRDGSLT